eukprot:jgi/Chlat1/2157/Chrsp17S08744
MGIMAQQLPCSLLLCARPSRPSRPAGRLTSLRTGAVQQGFRHSSHRPHRHRGPAAGRQRLVRCEITASPSPESEEFRSEGSQQRKEFHPPFRLPAVMIRKTLKKLSDACPEWLKRLGPALLVAAVVFLGANMTGMLDLNAKPTRVLARPSPTATAATRVAFRPITALVYALDVMLERYPSTYILLLAALTTCLVVTGALLFSHLERGRPVTFSEALWKSWSCVVSSSTHTKEEFPLARFVAFLLCIGGVLSYSLLTSTLSVQMKARLEVLRAGAHTAVLERDHVVIAGRNNNLLPLLKEINSSHTFARMDGRAQRTQTVLLLCEEPRQSMEFAIAALAKQCPHLNILYRRGSLSSTDSFERVAIVDAKSVILLAHSAADTSEADAQAVLSTLALQPLLSQMSKPVIVQVAKPSSSSLIKAVGGEHVDVLAVSNLSSKLFIQCARQPGLAGVYTELLKHTGNVINIRQYPEVAGMRYGALRRNLAEAVVCGLVHADGLQEFHPDDNYQLQPCDRVLLISAKRTHQELPPSLQALAAQPQLEAQTQAASATAEGATNKPVIEHKTPTTHSTQPAPMRSPIAEPRAERERVLLCGWRPDVVDMASELDHYVGPGSELVVLSKRSVDERERVFQRKLKRELCNVKVTHVEGDTMSRTDLTSALTAGNIEASLKNELFNHSATRQSVFVIGDTDWQSRHEYGAKTDKESVYTLLMAEEVCQNLGFQIHSLVAELVDTHLGDQVIQSHPSVSYIGSSEMMALFTSQVAEHRELHAVWTELLNAYGSEIYIKSPHLYIAPGESVPFTELAERAKLRGEVAIGYRLDGKNVINPLPKTNLIKLDADDGIVVFAQDDG